MKSPSFIHALNLNILRNKILNKIMSIPQKKKKEPDLALIGPLLKDAEYYSDSEIIRELYANLVAASANKDYDGKVHLAFSSIIKQISPHDAALLIRLPHQGPLASYFMMPGFEVLYEDVYLEDENDEYNFANTLSIQNFERLGFWNWEDEYNYVEKICINVLKKIKFIKTQKIERKKSMATLEVLYYNQDILFLRNLVRCLEKFVIRL